VARLAAYRNVLVVSVQTNGFSGGKDGVGLDRIFQVVQASDYHHHLRSIHNGFKLYNYTFLGHHASIQQVRRCSIPKRAMIYRDVYSQAIVYDE